MTVEYFLLRIFGKPIGKFYGINRLRIKPLLAEFRPNTFEYFPSGTVFQKICEWAYQQHLFVPKVRQVTPLIGSTRFLRYKVNEFVFLAGNIE